MSIIFRTIYRFWLLQRFTTFTTTDSRIQKFNVSSWLTSEPTQYMAVWQASVATPGRVGSEGGNTLACDNGAWQHPGLWHVSVAILWRVSNERGNTCARKKWAWQHPGVCQGSAWQHPDVACCMGALATPGRVARERVAKGRTHAALSAPPAVVTHTRVISRT